MTNKGASTSSGYMVNTLESMWGSQ